MPENAKLAKLKVVRLELSSDRHQRLRELAAATGQPMSRFVRALVEREINKRQKRLEHGQ